MKVAIIQHDIVPDDRQATLLRIEREMERAGSADLYVLPEMFATGFGTTEAEPDDGPTLRWMRQTARRLDAAVAGSVATACPDGLHRNRLHFVKPDGAGYRYDKRHLFSFGGEQRLYAAGTERVVAEHKGVRFLLQVCYDLRFPVWSRSRGDYDAAIYVASWPEQRIAAWDILLRARAVENQCYVIGANRVGDDSAGHYSGRSVIVDCYGRVAAAADDNSEGAVTAEIDIGKLRRFREKFPALDDGDPFVFL